MRAYDCLMGARVDCFGIDESPFIRSSTFAPGTEEESWAAACWAGAWLAEALRGCSHGRHRRRTRGPAPGSRPRRGSRAR